MMRRTTTVETYDWDSETETWVKHSKTVTEVVDQTSPAIVIQQPYVSPATQTWPYPYRAIWSATTTGAASKYLTFN